jgi:hypothetical protein
VFLLFQSGPGQLHASGDCSSPYGTLAICTSDTARDIWLELRSEFSTKLGSKLVLSQGQNRELGHSALGHPQDLTIVPAAGWDGNAINCCFDLVLRVDSSPPAKIGAIRCRLS